MKPRNAILVSSVAVLFVAFVLWSVCALDREPVYKGKKTSVWVNALGDGSLDTSTLEREFARMERNVLPVLTQALERKNSLFHKVYSAIHPRLPASLRSRLARPYDAVMGRCNAIYVLGSLGTNAAPAIPTLLKALDDDDARVRQAAAGSLGILRQCLKSNTEWDADAVAQLTNALQDGDLLVQINAASSISAFGSAAIHAVPTLVKMVSTSSGYAKANAIFSLGRIGEIPEHVVPAIRAAVDDPNREVRQAAAKVIEKIEGHE